MNDKISYYRQISLYKKLAGEFVNKAKLSSASDQGKWYLPEWLDDEVWEYTHSIKHTGGDSHNIRERESFLKKYPSWEDFKNYCYNMAQGEKYDICTDESGWCSDCARNDSWSFEKERAKKIK